MSAEPTKRPRRVSPNCTRDGCKHSKTFHPRDRVKHRRACKAFGCKCADFIEPDTTAKA